MSLEQVELVIFFFAVFANISLLLFVRSYSKQNLSRATFSIFVVAQIYWVSVNYLAFIINEPSWFLILAKLTLLTALLHIASFTLFIYSFLRERQDISRSSIIPAVILVLITAVVTLSRLTFIGTEVNSLGQLSPVTGPGINIFGITVGIFFLLGIFILIRRYRKAKGIERLQWRDMASGLALTSVLIILFSFLGFVLFGNLDSVRFGHVYTLPFIFFTAHAIVRHQLFSLKVIITEFLVVLLWLFILIRTLLYDNLADLWVGLVLLLAVVIIGILLVRSVRKEVQQREQLEKTSKALQEANVKLHELDNMKTEFLSLASHQLRSPLTAIKGYSSMALEGTFGRTTNKMSDAFSKIFESSQRLTGIINDLLDVSKIEQGGLKYEMRTMSVSTMVQSVVDELQLAAKEKGLKLVFNAPASHKFAVKGDNLKLRQVIQNLVDNAIKYTEKGQIEVKVEFTNKKEKILVSITDTGMGISAETLGKLFQKFSRGEAGKSNTSGSGLGLYLAQQIVKAHAGQLWAESPGLGKGSTFFVELPTQYA
jgi:signal transduction histidine kinase